MKHYHNIVIVLSLIILSALGFYAFSNQSSERVSAGAADNVSDWAWSSNVGWISYNCTDDNTCDQADYGVHISPGDGLFSGYAWSDNVGWISFDQVDLSGCPASPCEARVGDIGSDVYPKLVSGWAKVLSSNSWVSLRGEISITTETTGPEEWNVKADMPTNRHILSAAVVNGKVYAIGGQTSPYSTPCISQVHNTPVNEEYNPTTNSWTTKARSLTATDSGTAAVVNGKIYEIGGHSMDVDGCSINTIYNQTKEYDPSTNAWTQKAPMINGRHFTASAVVNDKIYVFGGSCNPFSPCADNINEEYDPLTNSWTSRASMPTGRAYVAATAVNNKIYVIGGRIGYDINEEYDPATNTWRARAPMPTGRYWHTATAINGKVYVFGGIDSGGNWTSSVEVYDPATNSWSSELSMPVARMALPSGDFVINNAAYLIGGREGASFPGTITRKNEEFKPESMITTMQSEPYGIQLESSGDLTGWSWEPDVIGWTSWSGSNYGVFTTAHLETPPPPPPGGEGDGGGGGGGPLEVPPTPGVPREVGP